MSIVLGVIPGIIEYVRSVYKIPKNAITVGAVDNVIRSKILFRDTLQWVIRIRKHGGIHTRLLAWENLSG